MFGINERGIGGAAAMALAMTCGLIGPGMAAETALDNSDLARAPLFLAGQTAGQNGDTGYGELAGLPEPLQGSSQKKRRAITFKTPGGTLAPPLDGLKVLGWKGPGVNHKAGFDMTVEIHGLGVQFEERGTYGYMRADRAFSGATRVGIRFRFRY